jgi:Na+/melibiose symporter-like transporter
MKKVKRVLAIAGVVILAALYVITFVAAIFAAPEAKDFFMASIVATIMIPILIYVYLVVYRLVTGSRDKPEKEEAQQDK